MLCVKCQKRPAVVFVQRLENGKTVQEGYCLTCARALGIKPVDDLMKQFGMRDEDLEAMEERQISIDGEQFPLPAPFLVLATQNPVESESTFRLPAAQLDRFMLRLSLGYPTEEEEARMLSLVGDEIPFEAVSAVSDPEELRALQLKVRQIAVSTGMTDRITHQRHPEPSCASVGRFPAGLQGAL